MSNEQPDRDLTFREYPDVLLGLLATREQLEQDRCDAEFAADPAMLNEAITALDSVHIALVECVMGLVRKADSVAAFIGREQSLADSAKEESERTYALAKTRQGRVDWMKRTVVMVMQELDLKLLQGDHAELRRHGNGGVQPVEVRQPELLPAKYQRFELRITGEEKEHLADLIDELSATLDPRMMERAKPIEPDTELIRKDLLTGEAVPGALLNPRGEHLRVK